MLWGGREGLIATAVVLTLPLLALWAARKLFPLRPGSENYVPLRQPLKGLANVVDLGEKVFPIVADTPHQL